jgi:hypothetical protein
MICFAKPGLTEDLCVVHKKEFLVTCYMCDTYSSRKVKHIHKRQTHPLVRENVTQGLSPQEFSCKKTLVVSLKTNLLAVTRQS